MVGNKSDISSKYRRVQYEQGVHFSRQHRCPFMEVSARRNEGIDTAFENLIKLWLSGACVSVPAHQRIVSLTNNLINTDSKKKNKKNNKQELYHHDCVIS